MAKENKYILEVELTKKPYTGFSFAKTRRRFTEELMKFEIQTGTDTKKLFVAVSSFEITEQGTISVIVRLNDRVTIGSETNAIKNEEAICDLIELLEKHLGVTVSSDEDEKTLDGLYDQGIIPAAYIKKFEQQDD